MIPSEKVEKANILSNNKFYIIARHYLFNFLSHKSVLFYSVTEKLYEIATIIQYLGVETVNVI